MANPAPSVGETITHYRVLGKIGAGGMGVVYKALDVKLERTVCLKFLPADVSLNDRDRESLLKEARAASTLDHPNIGAIYGIEESADHQPFIVMAYYEGETLAQAMANGSISSRPLDILLQIARGLAAAHARNIVHRDVKPSNIIINKDGTAKIVDFGLARVLSNSALTHSRNTSGTLPYMAPEQVLGETVTAACDVWALGLILVELLAGTHPFYRDNSAAMAFAILNQPPSALEKLPPALCPVAYRSLAKLAEHRYPTAKEFLADLETVVDEITRSAAAVGSNALTQTNSVTARQLKQFAERASEPRWSTATSSSRMRRIPYIALVVLMLMAAPLLVPRVRERLSLVLGSTAVDHIAVLPFDNESGDPANEAVAAGLMDSLTGELSNLSIGKQTLWVVPASVVRSRKVTDPVTALKELGVNFVVKGSIRRSANDVRLRVDLIDARNLRQIGSASLEDRTGDIGALQDEAVARLASLMNIKVSGEMLRSTGGRASPVSYELYLKALGDMQRYDKPGNLDQAITALNDAVKRDPQFALGFASLGEAYRLKDRVDPNPKWVEQALANLEHAVQVNDRIAAPFVSLAAIHSSVGNHDLALQEFQKALAINPRDPEALKGMAREYENTGHIAEAEANFRQAIALRPDDWDSYNSLGYFYFRQQRYPDAIAQFRRVIALTPDNAAAYSNLAGAYIESSLPNSQAEAEAALKRSLEITPSYNAYANLGLLYLNQKRYSEGAVVTRKALEMNDHDYGVWANLALMYQWLHDEPNARQAREHTIVLLEKYAKDHPQDARAHSSLSTYYAGGKDRAGTLREIESALALDPKNASVLADVAEAYEELGDRKLAIDFTEKSLKNGGTLDDLQNRPDMQRVLADPGFRPAK